MRILHTSDWHIGRKLYDYSLINEHEKFLDWLLTCIKDEGIDLLVVAGDIFDSAVPAGIVTDLYYKFLYRLFSQTNASAIIIAGNHDSPTRLGAPKEFLKLARIHVLGSLPNNIDECVIKVGTHEEMVCLVALPYVPEGELIPHISFEKEIETSRRYRKAIKECYQRCINSISEDLPKILMGHFFLQGGEIGESERVINIGGTEPVCTGDLPEGLTYGALGHLHRPQIISDTSYPLVYSGSPLPMTFREALHDKYVYVLDTNSPLSPKPIKLPKFRELKRVSGTLREILRLCEKGDFMGTLVEATLIIDEPVIGAADIIRQAFHEKGASVLSIQARLLDTKDDVEFADFNDLAVRLPDEIFKEFYMTKYDGKLPDSKLLNTFIELLKLVEERRGEGEA